MRPDNFTAANRHLLRRFALLDTWIEESKPVDSTSIHDRAVVVRECMRECLDRMGELEDAMRACQQ